MIEVDGMLYPVPQSSAPGDSPKRERQAVATKAEAKKEQIQGQARHVLTALAGILLGRAAAKAGVDQGTVATVSQVGAGAVIYGAGALWSWFAKRKAKRKSPSTEPKPRKPRATKPKGLPTPTSAPPQS